MTASFRIFLATTCLVLAATSAGAQELEQQIFGEAAELRTQAETASAALLSPKAYISGANEYAAAERDFQNGKNLERIKERLIKAGEYFEKAVDNAAVAKLTLKLSLESREAANQAEAFRLAPLDWTDGEKQFDKASRSLEKGNLDSAMAQDVKASDIYRLAELNAIKALYLSEARSLIVQADQEKVGKFAPNTLNNAQALLQQADALLEESRYLTDEPALLANRASYQARHAIYLAGIVRKVREGQMTVETVVLDWETPLNNIAAEIDIEPDFSDGYANTSKQITRSLEHMEEMERELAERDRQIAGLDEEIRELDSRLGGASEERTNLVRRLEKQARIREQFEQVEGMFAPEEAIVLRDGNTLILRLVGLNFASGSSQMDNDAVALMNKVMDAVDVFPRSDLLVEGHTDAFGGASQNQRLSQARSQAIMDYMSEQMRIPTYRIKAVGYGDTRPIANNKSADGRAKNRRIDLIIIPKPDGSG